MVVVAFALVAMIADGWVECGQARHGEEGVLGQGSLCYAISIAGRIVMTRQISAT